MDVNGTSYFPLETEIMEVESNVNDGQDFMKTAMSYTIYKIGKCQLYGNNLLTKNIDWQKKNIEKHETY